MITTLDITTMPHMPFIRTVLEGGDHMKTLYPSRVSESKTAFGVRSIHHDEPIPGPFPVYLWPDGMFSLLDGQHRCCRWALEGAGYAIVNLDPATGIHPIWKSLDSALLSIYHRAILYQEIEHPYFSFWQLARDPRRSKAVRDALEKLVDESVLPRYSNALELGCHFGRVSREMSRMGFKVDAVDQDDLALSIGSHLNSVFRTDVRFALDDIIKVIRRGRNYDVTVILSVVHHWLETAKSRAMVADLLDRIIAQSKVIVFDIPSVEGSDKAKVPEGQSQEWINEFYLSRFTDCQVTDIGTYDERHTFAAVNMVKK
jgi:SAM-dependent methyltransferase